MQIFTIYGGGELCYAVCLWLRKPPRFNAIERVKLILKWYYLNYLRDLRQQSDVHLMCSSLFSLWQEKQTMTKHYKSLCSVLPFSILCGCSYQCIPWWWPPARAFSVWGQDGSMLPENSLVPCIFGHFARSLRLCLENQILSLRILEHFDSCQVYCWSA